jgi:hypothetical protein
MRRNPLIFDNRFDPKEARGSGSRVVASLVAPSSQRVQVTRLADSPHTIRVILFDTKAWLSSSFYGKKRSPGDLKSLSQPGCITLLIRLEDADTLDERSYDKSVLKTESLARYTAFAFLHSLGDQIYPNIEGLVFSDARRAVSFPSSSNLKQHVPTDGWSKATEKLAKSLLLKNKRLQGGDPQYTDVLRSYIMSHTNSQMSRDAMHAKDLSEDKNDVAQYIADWVALSELPSARARPGRGEPWLLFPPRQGEYPPNIEKKLKKFSENINTYFPPFIQSLLDDLDGAVFRPLY